MKQKFNLLNALFFAVILIPTIAFAQYPTPLVEADFPSANDSVRIYAYMIPATQAFPDSTSANDSLSIDRTIEKAIQVNNPLDPMSDVYVGGLRNDTIAMFYYQSFAKPPYIRKYDAWNSFLPGAASFTQANLHTIIPSSEGDAHTYYKKDATGFYELGFYVVTSQGPMTSQNVPQKPIVLFPVDYASPNNVTNLTVVATAVASTATIVTTSDITITIDAYGDVTIIDGSISSPTYTTYTDYLRVCTYSEDDMDLGSGLNYYLKTKIFAYYVPQFPEPVASYSVTQIRSNIDPTFWSMAGQWEDELEFAYLKPIIPSDINESETAFFNIFPNPTEGLVTLNFEQMPEETITVEIFNQQGQLMGTFSRTENAVNIDMTQYPSGTYIVHLKINDKVFPSKLIKL